MRQTRMIVNTVIALLLVVSMSGLLTACDSLPEDRGTRGAIIGGAGGAVLGAVVAKENRLLGALIGGALGAGGGYLIGAKTDWFGGDKDKATTQAQASADNARHNPATAEQARRARTADINNDGFVTLDEVVAMERAGFNDDQMIRRLQATGQVFDLNDEQERALLDAGVSRRVVREMVDINRAERDRILSRSA